MKAHGIAATKGHLASNGGLRGHSVGDEFPYIVVARIINGDTRWFVRDPAGTFGVESHTSARMASAYAKYCKLNNIRF